ncbi:MAG TPA: DNA-binding domain-containing protein [Polyangiaceae bacterium]|nr:DNA-binding domain-containing protein [Polyangiaceae bacterium]
MTDSLSELQRRMVGALRHDGALTQHAGWSQFALEHVSGNDRLSPAEQLEIYREQFWLRHTGSLVEDFPGLSGILGQEDWEKLAEHYLREVTPDSYTLRDLGARLPELIERASWLPHQALCLDMARLELAYIEVFDARDTPPLAPERLATIPEEAFADARLVIAPSVRLLEVRYPVADLRRRLRTDSAEAVAIPDESPLQLVVYRRELGLWDMPLSRVAFAFLSGLVAGKSLGAAAEMAASTPEAESELAQSIGGWLGEWTTKGLVCDVLVD